MDNVNTHSGTKSIHTKVPLPLPLPPPSSSPSPLFRRHRRTPATRAGMLLWDKKMKHILLVPQKSTKWGIPKGGQKPGEKLWDTAVRELKEETGLDFARLKAQVCGHTWYEHLYPEDLGFMIYNVVSGTHTNPVPKWIDSNDIRGRGKWVRVADLDKFKLNKITKTIIQSTFRV